MLARDAVSLFQQRLGGQYARAKLLGEINHAQNEILCLPDIPICKTQGNTFLATTDGIVDYDLPAGVRTVSRIFSRDVASDGYQSNGDSRWVKIGITPVNEVDYTFYCDESPAYGTLGAVHFPADFNPGTTTDFFLLEQYIWPVPLLAESIAMTLPDQYVTSLLYYMVKMRVEESAYGVDIYNDPKFQAMLRSFQTRQANASKTEQYVRKARF